MLAALLLWGAMCVLVLWLLGTPFIRLYAACMRLLYRRGEHGADVVVVRGTGSFFATRRTTITLGYHATERGAELAARRGAVVADRLTQTHHRDWGIRWGVFDRPIAQAQAEGGK